MKEPPKPPLARLAEAREPFALIAYAQAMNEIKSKGGAGARNGNPRQAVIWPLMSLRLDFRTLKYHLRHTDASVGAPKARW